MAYTKKQFLEDVTKEAVALKKHATAEELSKLNFEDFDANNWNRCIYGQITGDCVSERANELILKCCKRYFDFNESKFNHFEAESMKGLNKHVNGETIEGVRSVADLINFRRNLNIEYMSTIEAYILTPFGKPKNLIAFLKGERKDLKL